MPSKVQQKADQRRKEKKAREAAKKIRILVLLTCRRTKTSAICQELGDQAAQFSYKFPLNGDLNEFERVTKNMADYLLISFKNEPKMTRAQKEAWGFKIRGIKASNENLKIFCNRHAFTTLPPQARGRIIEEQEVAQIFTT